MFAYSDLLFQYGMLDSIEAQYFKSEEMKAVAFIQNGQYLEAFEVCVFHAYQFVSEGTLAYWQLQSMCRYINI